jgi:hypothetical protein
VSRYQAIAKNGNPIAWGFDRPLQEYFFQEYMAEEKVADHQESKCKKKGCACGCGIIFSVSSVNTLMPHPKYPDRMKWSNNEILELMRKYPEIPRAHRQAIAADLPF